MFIVYRWIFEKFKYVCLFLSVIYKNAYILGYETALCIITYIVTKYVKKLSMNFHRKHIILKNTLPELLENIAKEFT